MQLTLHSVCIVSSIWARSCFWIGVFTPHQIFSHPLFLFTLYFILLLLSPFLLLYFSDPITTSDIQEAIQNHKDTTLGSVGIKNHTYNVTHLPQSILSTLSLIYNYILKTAQFPSYYLVKHYI